MIELFYYLKKKRKNNIFKIVLLKFYTTKKRFNVRNKIGFHFFAQSGKLPASNIFGSKAMHIPIFTSKVTMVKKLP